MPYSYANLNDALGALSARLYDDGVAGQPAFQQWTQTELTGYLQEALRTWNALSGFWRTEMVFPLAQNQFFYDIHAQNNSVVPYTVTQLSLVEQIESHLLEPPTTSYPLTWTGSNQFALSDILSALQRRCDETISTSGCTVTPGNVNAPIGGRVTLTDNIMEIRRVVWIPGVTSNNGFNNFGYPNKILRQSDAWAQRAFNIDYTAVNQQPPQTWFQSTEPPISFSVDFTPPVPGNYNLLTVNSGPPWSANNAGGLTIPDDWTWVAKWGAMFDLLSRESSAKDALRADYCQKRYQEGLEMLESAPTVLALRLNNIPIAVDPLRNGDDFNPSWQAASNMAPTAAYLTANLLAFGTRRIPEGGSGGNNWSPAGYSVTASVVQNAPVPVAGNDYIQVARDDYDTIIDYAQHLALFKTGGSEFAATVSLYQKFQQKAAQYNNRLADMGFFEWSMQDLGRLEADKIAVNAGS